jgi:hypothetical protein
MPLVLLALAAGCVAGYLGGKICEAIVRYLA